MKAARLRSALGALLVAAVTLAADDEGPQIGEVADAIHRPSDETAVIEAAVRREASTDGGGGGASFADEHGSPPPPLSAAREAYVTLCYGDSYVIGVRVLGSSIRRSGSAREMVALVTEVSEGAIATLELDGWTVRRVDRVDNPGKGPRKKGRAGYPPRFWAVYTKLLVFGLTQFSRIVYLDADTMVVSNLDHLFACAAFCAVMRVGERFNSGLMVIEPRTETLDNMMERITTTPSYTGGDQGFLNEYFKDIIDAPMFHPENSRPMKGARMMRLGTEYNSDVGAYVINGGMWHQEHKPKVLHFTLGPFKPWHWWMSWITDLHDAWLEEKAFLASDTHGYTKGESFRILSAKRLLLPGPMLIFTYMLITKSWHAGLQQCLTKWFGHMQHGRRRTKVFLSGSQSKSFSGLKGFSQLLVCVITGRTDVAAVGGELSHGVGILHAIPGMHVFVSVFGVLSLLLSLGAAVFFIVPHDCHPVIAWALVYEWTFLGLILAVSRMLWCCYHLGLAFSSQLHSSPRFSSHSQALDRTVGSGELSIEFPGMARVTAAPSGALQAWEVSVIRTLLSASIIVVSPWVSHMLQIQDIVARILITAFSGVIALSVLCHSLGDMAMAWFSEGEP